MTRLSSIPQAPAAAESDMLIGVEADIPDFNPPAGLVRIAFTAKMDDGALDETLLDALIGATMSGLDTIIEIPAEMDGIDAPFLVKLAANLSASLAILPPNEEGLDSDGIIAAREKWYRVNEEFAIQLLSTESFNRYIHPISSYLEYMFAETLRPIEAMRPTDPYILKRFADDVPQEAIDELKERLRKVIHDAAGGEENFRQAAHAIMHRIYRLADDNGRDMLEKIREEKNRAAAS